MLKDGEMVKSKSRMKIGIISSLLHPRSGGPASVVKSHVEMLKGKAETKIFGLAKKNETLEVESIYPGVSLFKPGFPERWFRGVGLTDALCENAGSLDILHAHMFWDHTVFASWKASRRLHKPLVITPHGSVSENWRYKSLHKQIYRIFILERVLRDTSAIHALNKTEELALRKFGYKGRIDVIPNGVPEKLLETRISRQKAIQTWPQFKDKRVLLYLGRIWKGKGMDILIPAWKEVLKKAENNGWHLVLAGPDYRGYGKKLKSQIVASGLEKNITMTGLVGGQEKESLMALAEVFILPSHSEGFSMALLEAMAAGLPCVYTDRCNFPELASAGGGILIKDEIVPLIDALTVVIKNSLGTNKSIGAKGRALGKRHYTHKVIGKKLLKLYHSL